MFHVYQKAHVTLAAAAGRGGSAGLWIDPGGHRQETLAARLRLRGVVWPLYIRPRHDEFYDWKNLRYPLFSRAWAYQERLVSPRLLLFMGSEVAYQCFQACDCECGLDAVPPQTHRPRWWATNKCSATALAASRAGFPRQAAPASHLLPTRKKEVTSQRSETQPTESVQLGGKWSTPTAPSACPMNATGCWPSAPLLSTSRPHEPTKSTSLGSGPGRCMQTYSRETGGRDPAGGHAPSHSRLRRWRQVGRGHQGLRYRPTRLG